MRYLLLICPVLAGCGIWSALGQEPAKHAEPEVLGQPVTYWIKALKDPEALVREEAILVLGNAGPVAKAAIPSLTPLLKDELSTIRVQAAIALGKIGGPNKAAMDVLLEAWKGGDASLRLQIVPALGSLARETPDALTLLFKASIAEDVKLRGLALEALARVGPAAVPSLTKVLENPNPTIRKQAFLTLEQMGHGARATAPALAARLKDTDWETRFRAAQILWPIQRDRSILAAVVIEAATKADAATRKAGQEWLFRLKPPPKEAIAALRMALQDSEPSIRVRAAVALWELEKQAKDVLPILIGVLQLPDGEKNQNSSARHEATLALKHLGVEAKPARQILLQMIRKGHDWSELPRILACLGPESIPDLIEIISGPKSDMHSGAIRTLALMGNQTLDPIIKVLDLPGDMPRIRAWHALELLGAEALPAYRKALKSKNTIDRWGGVMCLLRMGPTANEALSDLIEVAGNDPDVLIRHRALCALAHLRPEEKTVRPLLNGALKSPEPLIRVTAADWLWTLDQDKSLALTVAGALKDNAAYRHATRLLLRMGPHAKPALPALIEVLESEKPYVSADAAQILRQMGPVIAKDAIPALLRALDKKEPELRVAAARALHSFGVEQKKAAAALIDVYDKAEPFRRSGFYPAFKEFGPAAKDALPRFQAHLSDYSPFAHIEAASIILAIDPSQIKTVLPFLERALNGPANSTAPIPVAMLLWKGDPDNQLAFAVLEDKLYDPPFRWNALWSLEADAGPWAKAAVPALTQILKDADPGSRVKAAQALWKIQPGNKDTLPTLLAVLKDKDAAHDHREAAKALGGLGPAAKEAVPALQAALRASILDFERYEANEALRKIDPKAALPVLLEGY